MGPLLLRQSLQSDLLKEQNKVKGKGVMVQGKGEMEKKGEEGMHPVVKGVLVGGAIAGTAVVGALTGGLGAAAIMSTVGTTGLVGASSVVAGSAAAAAGVGATAAGAASVVALKDDD